MKVIKFIFFLLILCFSIYYINTHLIDSSFTHSIIKTENSSSKKNNKIINNMFNLLSNKSISDITSLLGFKVKENKESNKVNEENETSEVIGNSVIKESNEPIIYIYNTHQTEGYSETSYGITPTVMTASSILEEELLTKNLISVVEEKSIKKELNKRGLVYSNSYRISREFLEEARKTYPTLKYFFDVHRDSIDRSIAVASIDGKDYAKVMFIVAQNHDNYKENEKNIKIMEEYLKENYNGILRNTYYQPLYDYNQDVNSTTFLIELGGPENTLEEVYNSSVAIAEAIEYLIMKNEG